MHFVNSIKMHLSLLPVYCKASPLDIVKDMLYWNLLALYCLNFQSFTTISYL